MIGDLAMVDLACISHQYLDTKQASYDKVLS